MKLDFFDKKCQEPPINHIKFGICDDQEGARAYTSLKHEHAWVATVENKNKVQLTFTAIDKCVLKDDDFKGRERCDGMLTSEIHLYLVELKNMKKRWQTKTIGQLESTIQFLFEYHKEQLEKYHHKKAFGCNQQSKVPIFRTSQMADKKRIYDRYGFILDLQAKVVVV